MRAICRAGWGALCVLMIGGMQLGAQQPKQPASKAEPAPAPKVSKDPTQPSPKLRDVLDTAKGPGGLPAFVLRGRIIIENQPAGALLELEPKQPPLLISAGTEFAVGGVKMRVLEVTANGVRIEISSRNEVIVLR
jgi:hypothetical protein